MKLLPALALILALQLSAQAAQAARGARRGGARPAKEKAAKAGADAPRAAEGRTVVCIDPGHPSEVASGKNLQNGTSETHVNWAVASKLRDILEEGGYEVVLTKSEEDEVVRNKDRALVANRARAALMVRLHCDASTERGFAVYYPDRPGRAKDGTTGPAPRVVEESRKAAAAVHAGLAEGLRGALEDNGVRTDYQTKVGRDQGGALTGSIFSEVPVVTVEMVVLSDAADADFIKTDEGQRRMAESIAEGVRRYVGPAKQVSPRSER